MVRRVQLVTDIFRILATASAPLLPLVIPVLSRMAVSCAEPPSVRAFSSAVTVFGSDQTLLSSWIAAIHGLLVPLLGVVCEAGLASVSAGGVHSASPLSPETTSALFALVDTVRAHCQLALVAPVDVEGLPAAVRAALLAQGPLSDASAPECPVTLVRLVLETAGLVVCGAVKGTPRVERRKAALCATQLVLGRGESLSFPPAVCCRVDPWSAGALS